MKNAPEKWPKTALYEGIIPRMERSILHSDEGKRHQKQLDRFVTVQTCHDCQGSRVNEKVRSCKINEKSIADLVELSLDELQAFIATVDAPLVIDLKPELTNRLQALIDIGLSYLTLNRSTSSLSGGEAQRIRISKYINNALNDVLYILNEPSAGLYSKDIERINRALQRLKAKGNTVVLVEHHPQLIQTADYIIDIGPAAGEQGGQVQFAGPYHEFLKQPTITSQELQKMIPVNDTPRHPQGWLAVEHANLHNLKDVSTKIPLGVMTVLCGVAGSGKSSFGEVIRQTALENKQEVIAISQKSIGINLRSTPLTYLDIFSEIRQLFAKENQVSTTLFSYNSKGACPHCKGKGVIVSDMAFMDDIVTECEICHGTRYRPEVLAYMYQGKTIVDILDMTVNESSQFFAGETFVK